MKREVVNSYGFITLGCQGNFTRNNVNANEISCE